MWDFSNEEHAKIPDGYRYLERLLCFTHYRFFTRQSLEETIRAAGFTDIEILPQRTEPPSWSDDLPGELEVDAESLSTQGFYVVIRNP